MRPAWRGFALLVAGALVPGAASAQDRLAPGEWVRVSTRQDRSRPDWIVGELAVITGTYVVISPIGAGPLAIPHRSLTRLERQLGYRSRATRGTLLGGIAGGILAGALTLTTDCGRACLLLPVAGGTAGFVWGRGAVSMRWESVSPSGIVPRRIARLAPAAGPARLGLTLRF